VKVGGEGTESVSRRIIKRLIVSEFLRHEPEPSSRFWRKRNLLYQVEGVMIRQPTNRKGSCLEQAGGGRFQNVAKTLDETGSVEF
jgi:hypothetical protein